MSEKKERLPINLNEKVKIAKKMAREELGLPDNEVRFGIKATESGISLTHKSSPANVINYTWEDIELEQQFPES